MYYLNLINIYINSTSYVLNHNQTILLFGLIVKLNIYLLNI